MGNCATKPKVIKDSDEDLIPVDKETTAPVDHKKEPAEKSEKIASNAEEEAAAAAAAARRSEKGKDILIEDDVEEHSKRPSLSHLFHGNKRMEIGEDVTQLFPTNPNTNNKTGSSSEVLKLDTSVPMASNVKAPQIFDVRTQNDLEVKNPKDSEVKTPETPKAKEADDDDDQEVKFSENYEAKFPGELEVGNSKKTSHEVSKLPEVSAPELSEVKVTKESDVPEVLEDKTIPVSKVKTDVARVAESQLFKVPEVKSLEDLEIKGPKDFEVKNPASEIKTDQDASKAKLPEVTEVPEFVNAQEKIDKLDQAKIHEDITVTKDKEIVLPKTKKEEEKDVSLEKQVRETTLSDLEDK